MQKLKFLCPLFILICMFSTSIAKAAVVGAADQNGGYSNAVLDAVVKKWRPPYDGKERTVRIMVMIDGSGNLDQCMPLDESTAKAPEKAACDAVRSVKKFPAPPYGLPMDVYLSFWVGNKEGNKKTLPESKPSKPQAKPQTKPQTHEPKNIPSFDEGPVLEPESKPTRKPLNTESYFIPPRSYEKNSNSNNFEQNNFVIEKQELEPVEESNLPSDHIHRPVIQENRRGVVLDEEDHYVKMVMRKIGPNVDFPKDLPNKGGMSSSLVVNVDGSGNIGNVEIYQSSGYENLDNALVKAAKKTAKVKAPNDKKPRTLSLTFIINNI